MAFTFIALPAGNREDVMENSVCCGRKSTGDFHHLMSDKGLVLALRPDSYSDAELCKQLILTLWQSLKAGEYWFGSTQSKHLSKSSAKYKTVVT